MTMQIKSIPASVPSAAPAALTTQDSLRIVRAGVEALGGANNYAAQNTVQTRQVTQARKQESQQIDPKIVVATLAALAPVGSAHDEDEADAEREQDVFGSEWCFEFPNKQRKKKNNHR